MKIKYYFLLLLFLPLFSACQNDDENSKRDINKIELPAGFHIEVYADVPNARAMVLADDGTLFVGSRAEGKVHAITAGERKVIVIDENISSPAGVDLLNGDLYVSAVSRILKYPDILKQLDNPPEPVVITDQYPDEASHGWKFIKFGPDDKLYVPVGAPCNICLSQDSIFASITRISKDGSNMEIIAHGIRNTVGFDWHPETGVLWFTENGRDRMGDYKPPDEINKLTEIGQHFGYPYVHGDSVTDPQFWQKKPQGFEWQKPEVNLAAHVAALGMRFYTGDMFPQKYHNGIFFAEHGSWNRSSKIGYRVMFVPVHNGIAGKKEIFASGWLQGEEYWGRPVDVEIMSDGSVLVSDDYAGKVYRVYYE